MVVASGGRDIPADRLGAPEIEGGPGYQKGLSLGDQPRVDGKVARAIELELVVEDQAFALALEVKISVISQVDDGLGVGARFVGNRQGAILA